MTFANFLQYWYFHIPDLALAALTYVLVGRLLLEIVLLGRFGTGVLAPFRRGTEPALRFFRALTPGIVPGGLVLIFAIGWLTTARMAWYLGCVALGLRLKVGA
ncbi:MAG TPA: hypothetical protein VFV47_04430 [Hyphomicrobiaceae bacterium]|nr:hypothetical protein [Hyphomicrobiaceae bacterium]